MAVTQLEEIGPYMSLKRAAKLKGTSVNALDLWLRIHDVPRFKFERVLVVREQDITGYTPRSRSKMLV